MKKDIHPKVYADCLVTCACGNKFTTISTQKSIIVDICNMCHPLYTGQQRFVDAEGRIDKFARKMKIVETKKEKIKNQPKKLDNKTTTKDSSTQPTLKEMLQKSNQKAA